MYTCIYNHIYIYHIYIYVYIYICISYIHIYIYIYHIHIYIYHIYTYIYIYISYIYIYIHIYHIYIYIICIYMILKLFNLGWWTPCFLSDRSFAIDSWQDFVTLESQADSIFWFPVLWNLFTIFMGRCPPFCVRITIGIMLLVPFDAMCSVGGHISEEHRHPR